MKELSDYRASKLKQKAEECLATVCVDPDELLAILAACKREKGLRKTMQDDVRTFEDAPNDSYAAGWRDAARAYLGFKGESQ